MPFILHDRLDIPHSDIQRYVSILLASHAGASVLFSIPVGIIADRLPARQLPFLVGLFALLISTLLLALGQSIEQLILARIFQGMSGAVVWTIGYAMVLDTVGVDKLGVVIGSIFSFISIGELAAPVLGGIVYKKAGSMAVFGMAFGLLGVDFLMRLVIIEKKTAKEYGYEETSQSEDEEEANEGTALLTNGKTRDETLEEWVIDDEPSTWKRRAPFFYCLSDKRLLTAELVAFTQATLIAVFDATIPTESQDLFGFDSLQAGLMFAPLVTPYLIFGPLCGMLVDKYGPRIAACFGLGYLVIPLILLRIPHAGGTAEIVKFGAFLSLAGTGLALISAPSIVESSYVVQQYHKANLDIFGEQGPYAQLYAFNSMVFSSGLTIGPLIAGELRERIGYGNMNAVVAGMAGIVSLLSFLFFGKIPKPVQR